MVGIILNRQKKSHIHCGLPFRVEKMKKKKRIKGKTGG